MQQWEILARSSGPCHVDFTHLNSSHFSLFPLGFPTSSFSLEHTATRPWRNNPLSPAPFANFTPLVLPSWRFSPCSSADSIGGSSEHGAQWCLTPARGGWDGDPGAGGYEYSGVLICFPKIRSEIIDLTFVRIRFLPEVLTSPCPGCIHFLALS